MFNIYYLDYSNKIAAACDKVYQLLAHGRWFSPGTPASSTTKTGRDDTVESGVKAQKIIILTYFIEQQQRMKRAM
jgi:hypothetical protein